MTQYGINIPAGEPNEPVTIVETEHVRIIGSPVRVWPQVSEGINLSTSVRERAARPPDPEQGSLDLRS